VERSIEQGPSPDARSRRFARARSGTGGGVVVGLAVVALLLGIYLASNPSRTSYYNHFVWQAEAFLDGRAAIRFPVGAGPDGPGNDQFQDVIAAPGPHGEAVGYALVPFPPLPAVLLMPFVALWGLATNAQLLATILGALDVGIAFWILARLALRPRVRVAATLFLGLGTVLWYAAELGTTWFLAHVVAVGFTLLAIGVALGADPEAAAGDVSPEPGAPVLDRRPVAQLGRVSRSGVGWIRRLPLDGRQVLAGLLFGLACTARLTVVFGAPFFVFVGGGGGALRRGLSAGVGLAIPIGALLLYNLATTGHLLHPGYDQLYGIEAVGYPELGYHATWSIEDPRYLAQNLWLLVAGLPKIMPACDPGAVRGLFDAACPIIAPRDIGMSLFLTSPAWVLAFPALRQWGRRRVVTGAALAVGAIALADLMHFSQGWVQFGYRFSNDFAPFALLLLALVLGAGRRHLRLGYLLIGISIAVNAWGVLWGHLYGW
jgi:hypothetical protein